MHYYNIYGLHIKSNVTIELLEAEEYCENTDLEIELIYGFSYDFENIDMIFNTENEYLLQIPNTAFYIITSNKIVCSAIDYKSFTSTLFNIPFSVVMVLRGNLLLHACALCTTNGLVLLSGDKGIGKSTLSTALCKLEEFGFFADDTVRIDRDFVGYNAHRYVKLHPEVIDAMALSHSGMSNIAGKYYIDIHNKETNAAISCRKIYAVLYLGRGSNLQMKKIGDIGYIFKRSVVGIEFFHVNLLKMVLSSKFAFRNLYHLVVPDCIEEMLQDIEKIGKYIRGI